MENIHQLMHLYRTRQYASLKEDACELSHMEFKVLNYFWHHPHATQKDLVRHSGRDKSQLARLINGLKEKGLLDASVDPLDRRVVRISLTDSGDSIHAHVHSLGKELAEKAFNGLTEQESGQLLHLLQKIRNNLTD